MKRWEISIMPIVDPSKPGIDVVYRLQFASDYLTKEWWNTLRAATKIKESDGINLTTFLYGRATQCGLVMHRFSRTEISRVLNLSLQYQKRRKKLG